MSGLNERQRFGLVGLGAIGLAACGFVGSAYLQRPPAITIENPATPPPVVAQDSQKSSVPSRVIVHVVGAVKTPGVYEFPSDARVNDAIEKAGGSGPKADLEDLNLAAKLSDGSQLFVPVKGEVTDKVAEPYRGGAAAESSYRRSSSRGRSGSGKPAPGSISLNTASESQLEALPGVGPSTAQKILDYRKEHGGFTSIDEVIAVRGIGPKKLQAMRKYLRL